jgi:hypothetical protein
VRFADGGEWRLVYNSNFIAHKIILNERELGFNMQSGDGKGNIVYDPDTTVPTIGVKEKNM